MGGASGGQELPAEADLARERDLRKYYEPWLERTSVFLENVPANSQDDSFSSTGSSHDTTLTALAQLAALRLNVKRAMVSLIDRDTQIILAEATQTLSLVDEKRHGPGDHIWLGQVSVPRKDCMDEHTFGSEWSGQDSAGNHCVLRALVIPDTASDDRFRDRAYVLADPGVKFYAGVPITTGDGYEIGVYGVSDIKARPNGLSADEVLFMQDVARIITDYLERVKRNVDSERDEVFVKGMHHFIEDVSIMKRELDKPVGIAIGTRSSSKERPDIQATDAQDTCDSAHNTHGQPSQVSSPTLERSSSSASILGALGEKPLKYSRDMEPLGKDNLDSTSSAVKQIFQRAALGLRDALNAQGCIFIDASSGLYQNSPNENESESLAKSIDTPFEAEGDAVSETTTIDELEKSVTLLGMSLAEGIDETPFKASFMKRKHLQACLQRYPDGQYFLLEDGSPVPGKMPFNDEGITHDSGARGRPAHNLHTGQARRGSFLPTQMLKHVSTSKWLIFYPVFDYVHSHWCAGALMWSTDANTGDLGSLMPYLKTFASCLMSEVTSMEAFNTSMAKSTFIASMSHDLRSPLHGMLGSLEFLEDTMSTAYQMSLLGSVETCGKTLLDTIDHLLDFAKINNLNRAVADRGTSLDHSSGITRAASSTRASTPFDFGLVVEEVVEAVFAGQTFRKVKLRGYDPVDESVAHIQAIGSDDSLSTEEQIHGGSAKFSGRVFFVLDVQQARTWCMKGQTGGIRRVIMNIVGNAIKYCSKGCIEIIASCKELNETQAEVEIRVNDTGVGMSRNYLQNHLFKAFSQEDPFAPGAGLGLSIASQIVQGLHGKIHIQSEKGVGTHVKVTLPMELSEPGLCDQEDSLLNAARAASGKSICMLNPYAEDDQMTDGQLPKLTASIAKTCEGWLGMTCYESRTIGDDDDASIYVYCEPPPIEYLLKHHTDRRVNGKSGKEAALLIICTNAFEAAALRAAGISQLVNLGRIVEVISQPVGVRKIAKVLLQSLARVEASIDPSMGLHPSEAARSIFTTDEVKQRASGIQWHTSPVVYDHVVGAHRPSIDDYSWRSEQQIRRTGQETEPRQTFGDIKAGAVPGLGTSLPHRSVSNDTSTQNLPSVLLVDDNAINLKLLVTFMKKIKLPYAEAINGLEAYNKFKEADKPFDYVLMDLQMPIMDGLESTRKIREYEKESKLTQTSTIIAITGVGNEATRKEAMDAGMTSYFTKPVRFKALQQLLEQPRT